MQITQKEIAEKLGLHPATVSKILNREPTDYTSVETKQKVFALASQLGYDFNQLKSFRARAYTRKTVNLSAQVVIVTGSEEDREFSGSQIWDEGRAQIKNISLSGTLISDIRLSKEVLPLKPFRLVLVLQEGVLDGLKLPGQVVRFQTNGQTALGLRFDTVPEETRNRLTEFCSS